MRSKVLQRILDKTPVDVKIFVDKYTSLVLRINEILKEKGYTQKTLAERLDKKPSEINKWLSGEHNFTLRSIAKLEAELGEVLLEVPARNSVTEQYTNFSTTKYTFTVHKNLSVTPKQKAKVITWRDPAPQPQTELANVG